MTHLTRAAAAALIALTLAACGNATRDVAADGGGAVPADGAAEVPGSEDEAPDDQATDGDAPDGDADSSDDADAPDDADTPEGADDAPASGDEDLLTPTGTDGFRAEGRTLVRELNGEVHVLAVLPEEGESTFRFVTPRPGDHADLTVLALTQAEGFYDLRWLVVEGTEATRLQALPIQYQPLTGLASYNDTAPLPMWAPDGSAIAYLEWNEEGSVQLHTIGWADGPGTGDTATDNAAFGLDLPAPVQLQSWTAESDSHSVLRAVADDGRTWTITLERQADGAFAIGPDAVQPAS
jgi:hypothetical protein